MNKYSVFIGSSPVKKYSFVLGCYAIVEIEADTEDQAITKASRGDFPEFKKIKWEFQRNGVELGDIEVQGQVGG